MIIMPQPVELKLKQASAVLGVDAKDLQNLVQFKVLRPRRKDSVYWFDDRLLLTAKVAFYLKASLGTSSELLARLKIESHFCCKQKSIIKPVDAIFPPGP